MSPPNYVGNADNFARGFLDGCGEPCRIEHNNGGKVIDFAALAIAVMAQQRTVVIDGDCASACALFADLARAHVCLMPTARLLFHRLSNDATPPDAPDIVRWVDRHGGFPDNASGRTTIMAYAAAKHFFAPCCTPIDAAHPDVTVCRIGEGGR